MPWTWSAYLDGDYGQCVLVEVEEADTPDGVPLFSSREECRAYMRDHYSLPSIEEMEPW